MVAPPHFAMLWDEQIPRCAFADEAGRTTEVTVVAGQLDGQEAPGAASPLVGVARRRRRRDLVDPDAGRRHLDAAAGERARGRRAPSTSSRETRCAVGRTHSRVARRVSLRGDAAVPLDAAGGTCEMLLLQGRPIGEPVAAHGPFVMNTRAEIQRAFSDYQRRGSAAGRGRRTIPSMETTKRASRSTPTVPWSGSTRPGGSHRVDRTENRFSPSAMARGAAPGGAPWPPP